MLLLCLSPHPPPLPVNIGKASTYLTERRTERKEGDLDVIVLLANKTKRDEVGSKESIKKFLCPFAVYYILYAVRSFFTMSRISLVDGKRAGQKVQRKIAVAVQKVKSPLLFVPLF
jgi:hypothetical protein